MGRGKQFKKDKLYITPTEYASTFGGKKEQVQSKPFSTLQFFCCNISLQPWSTPMCVDGAIFDAVFLLQWYKKYKVNPVTGEPCTLNDFMYLNFAKNSAGEFHCPITNQVFTDHTHIVCIRTTGNVYAFKAIDELNIRTKNWKDLISGEPFVRKDIITLQDPNNYVDPATYYFIKKGLTIQTKEAISNDPLAKIVQTTTSESVFKEMKKRDEAEKERKRLAKELDSSSEDEAIAEPAKYRGSDSLTSTAFTAGTKKDKGWKPKKTTEKGHVRIVTNKGNLNFVIHCDLVPLAAENFLTLCQNDFYKNIKFHRNIRNFMIQGGDPTGTGKGGKSIWGKEFPDEFVDSLKHDGEGILSMANSGPDSNGSQFFITYKSANHLNKKHTVFGKLVGGSEVLKELANVQTDESDRPLEDIIILQTLVYTNPLSDAAIKEVQAKEKEKEKIEKEKNEYGNWLSNPGSRPAPKTNANGGAGIGKFITNIDTMAAKKRSALDFGVVAQSATTKKVKVDGKVVEKGSFANF